MARLVAAAENVGQLCAWFRNKCDSRLITGPFYLVVGASREIGHNNVRFVLFLRQIHFAERKGVKEVVWYGLILFVGGLVFGLCVVVVAFVCVFMVVL